MKKYSDKELEELADADLIWPRKGAVYEDKVNTELQCLRKNVDDWDGYISDIGVDLVSEELWWDCCKIINELAQLVKDERDKTRVIVADLTRTLQDTISEIKKIK